MKHPPPHVWILPPYSGPAHVPGMEARLVLALNARPARPPAERARVRLLLNLATYAADLSRSDVRNLREWLQQVEQVMDETAARRPDAPG